MMCRSFNPNDFNTIKQIHEEYYANEFSFEEFLDKLYCSFVVTDEHDTIITAGGVRTISELVLVTDKAFTPKIRREALLEILKTSMFYAKKHGYNSLHATGQDDVWLEQMKRYGFRELVGKMLIMDL